MEIHKMEFEEINPNIWKPEAEEDSVEGVYISKEENKGANNSNAYHLEKEGKQIMIWGTTIIDDRMQYAKIGEYVKIIYKGIEKNKKGQDLKIYQILRAKGLQ